MKSEDQRVTADRSVITPIVAGKISCSMPKPSRFRSSGMNEIMPVFVIGTFHSGTTILYRMLAMHPQVTWLSQFSQRHGRIPGRRWIPLSTQLDRVSRKLFRHDWGTSGGQGIRRLVVPTPQEAQYVWKHAVPPEDVDLGTSIDRIRSIVDEESRVWRHRTHLFIKDPYLSRHIPLLRSALPNAKFVHITRDGRAVALSLRAERLRSTYPGASDVEKQELLKNVAHYWVDVLEDIAAARGSIDLYQIRYEDFCADVRASLRMILRHVGLSTAEFPFERCPADLSPTNAKWIDAAPPEAIAAVEDIQAPWLAKLRYADHVN
jgi:sulfotransferase family protein